jgi:hypothetical protein
VLRGAVVQKKLSSRSAFNIFIKEFSTPAKHDNEERKAYLVDGVDDPVDARIAADGLVLGIDEDDLEVLVCRVLVNPVRVQDAQVGATAADTLFGGGSERSLVLELVDSLVGGFACQVTIFVSISCFHSFPPCP